MKYYMLGAIIGYIAGWIIGSALGLLLIWLCPILSRPISALWRDSAPTHTETATDGLLDTGTGPVKGR